MAASFLLSLTLAGGRCRCVGPAWSAWLMRVDTGDRLRIERRQRSSFYSMLAILIMRSE